MFCLFWWIISCGWLFCVGMFIGSSLNGSLGVVVVGVIVFVVGVISVQ